ncbi:MAG: PTS sugar transporter subunit IIB [Clostridia bacterium BRH_c25]|nr:MAG: PTS sugar transporter subunit IIB [Clostridia bacterium BRH_c25]
MLRVMLVCSAGMSTSLLVTKMKDAAMKNGIDLEIFAVSEVEVKDNIDQADVVLLAPQVRFLFNKMKQELEPKGIPTAVIDGMNYGLMRGDAVVKQALELTVNTK